MASVQTPIGTIDSMRAEDIRARLALYDYLRDTTAKALPEVTNAERSALEVYDFTNSGPPRYTAYVKATRPNGLGPDVTTWMGDTLARYGTVQLGKSWRSNMGDVRQHVRFVGLNGHTYSGTYYKSAGDYCDVKRVKA